MTQRRSGQPVLRAALVLLATMGLLLSSLWAAGMRLGFSAGWSDTEAYLIPKHELVVDRLRGGEMPLWNPWEFGGIPLLATAQPAAFHPLVWLTYGALSGECAHSAFFALHVVIGGLLGLLLARALGCRTASGVVAGLWVCQPQLLAMAYDHPHVLAGIVWLPLLVLLTRELVLRPSLRAASGLGTVGALEVFCGYLPAVLGVAYVLGLGLPFWWVERRRTGEAGPAFRVGLALALALGVAVLIAAVQLLPSLELTGLSDRDAVGPQAHARATEIGSSGRPVWRALGVPPPTFAIGLSELWSDAGPIVLALIALGIALRSWGPAGWYAVLAAGLCNLAPYWLLTSLPFYDYVRFALEWGYMAPLFLNLSLALAIEAAARRWRLAGSGVASLALIAVVSGTLANAAFLHGGPMWQGRPASSPAVPSALLEHCDLGPGRARAFWPFGQKHGVLLRQRIESIGGYEQSFLLPRITAVQRALKLPTGGRQLGWTHALARHPSAAARMGLRCAVTHQPAPALEKAGFKRLPRTPRPAIVYRSDGALPRARLVGESVRARSPEQALELLLDESIDPATHVILETPGEPLPACPSLDTASARVTLYEPEEVSVAIQTPCRAWLVLADTWLPGWQARVDGEARPIEIADYLFRAVPVRPGDREVVFRYRPASYRIGAGLSVAGLLACAACMALPAQRDPLRAGPAGENDTGDAGG